MNQGGWTDWIAALANALLALSIAGGAVVALRRWNVAFAVILRAGPFNPETSIDGIKQPSVTTWQCSLELADGQVAHIARIKMQRRRLGFWVRVQGAVLPQDHLPISLRRGGTLEFTVALPRGDAGPFRFKIDEYSTFRSARFPFVETERKNDFA